MTRSLFRNVSRRGVEYLLISGQASVLYGAATFSDDRLELVSRLGIRTTLEDSRRRIARRILRLPRADAAYWRPIVRELRELRNRGHLIPEGMSVRRLLHDR
jgi:hypothetical protein